MIYIEAPNEQSWPQGARTLFLAGGITGCPDWQQEVAEKLRDTPLVLFNPRRANFPIDKPDAAYQQIKWEHDHLRLAEAVFFWFPYQTLNPIVLYEFGAWSMTSKPLFVGAHRDYARLQDIIIQTKLARPDVRVWSSLDGTVEQVRHWSGINMPPSTAVSW